MSVPVHFAKLEATGNGYIAIDGRELQPRWPGVDWPTLARQVTDPNFGIGSDGVVVVETSDSAAIRMRVFNSDGSEAEMSGNGIRLFAKYVLDRGLAELRADALEVETAAGLRRVFPEYRDGKVVGARVAMDVPQFGLPGAPTDSATLLDVELGSQLRNHTITPVSLGNPHAVILSDAPVAGFDLHRVGPALQQHAWFPDRVNVEVVRVLGRGRIEARIFERGEGETLASGTGSTACAVVALAHGFAEAEAGGLDVELRGGTLRVEWAGPGEPAWLEGPAVEVFEGVWRAPEAK